jgi:hypothetical protein
VATSTQWITATVTHAAKREATYPSPTTVSDNRHELEATPSPSNDPQIFDSGPHTELGLRQVLERAGLLQKRTTTSTAWFTIWYTSTFDVYISTTRTVNNVVTSSSTVTATTTTAVFTTNNINDNSGKLSTSAILGIAVPLSAILFGLLGFLVNIYFKRRREKREQREEARQEALAHHDPHPEIIIGNPTIWRT